MKQTTYQQEEIRPFLIKYLAEATEQIHLAIGWIMDDGLLSLLQKKAIEGTKVVLILIKDEDFSLKSAAFQGLIDKGVRIIGLDESRKDYFIDHKFGVIDSSTVLTGNYGWGSSKSPAETFLNFTEEIPSLAKGFDFEFEYVSIAHQLSKSEVKPENQIVTLLKKIETIKTLLSVGDTEFIHLRFKELESFETDQNIALILDKLKAEAYEEALALIKPFTEFHQELRACIDPPIDSYRREIRHLEGEIAALSNEFSENQKLVHKFSKMHTEELGDLLQQLLFQTKVKTEIEAKLDQEDKEKQDEFEEAEKDHEEYTKSHEAAKKEKFKVLSKAEQKELKKLYRQTSLKCHPDRVVEELHDQAEEIFVELNQAYKANDLDKVREINQQLKSGIMLPKSEGVTELKKLESTCKTLMQKLKTWQDKLDELRDDPSYKTVSSIENWETYFQEKKEILLNQLNSLKEFNEANVEVVEGE